MLTISLDRPGLDRLMRGAVTARIPSAVFRVAGPGALDCLQGLFTSDLAEASADHLLYGAMLTPKGMIVSDYWALRDEGDFILIAPESAREATSEIFAKRLPPRLAKVSDLTTSWQTLWCLGDQIPEILRGIESPVAAESERIRIARGSRHMPFTSLVSGPATLVDDFRERATARGAAEGSVEETHAARVLAGWPAVGAEIDEKTLPQEVRFDAIEGVSYTKGCYIGQETVARVHFRGHPNRLLRGLDWTSLDQLSSDEVMVGEKPVGRIHSVLALPDRRLGLAKLRHTIEIGQAVSAGGHPAVVAELPFDPAAVAA